MFAPRARAAASWLAILSLFTPVFLSACSSVDIASKPAKITMAPNPTEKDEAANYKEAMTYLLAARQTLLAKARHRDTYDTVTKVGEGVGLAGAVANIGGDNATDPVTGFLTFGSINYAANKDVNPLGLATVYRTGANNLECIRAAAIGGHQDIVQAWSELTFADEDSNGVSAKRNAGDFKASNEYKRVANAILKLRTDITKVDDFRGAAEADLVKAQTAVEDAKTSSAAAGALPKKTKAARKAAQKATAAAAQAATDANKASRDAQDEASLLTARYDSPIKEAVTAIGEGRDALRITQRLLSDTALGEHILSGVNATLYAVNRDALDRSPDADAILQSASALGAFLDTGLGLSNKMKSVRTDMDKNRRGASLTAADDHGLDFTHDIAELNSAVAALPVISIDSDMSAVDKCRYSAQARMPVTVAPSPVALKAGESKALDVTGSAPFFVSWDGTAPENVTVDTTDGVKLTVGDKAADGSLHFHVRDSLGTDSDMITLNVTAAPKTDPSPAPGTTTTTTTTTSTPPATTDPTTDGTTGDDKTKTTTEKKTVTKKVAVAGAPGVSPGRRQPGGG